MRLTKDSDHVTVLIPLFPYLMRQKQLHKRNCVILLLLLPGLSAIHMKDSKASGCQRSLSFDDPLAFEGITYDG